LLAQLDGTVGYGGLGIGVGLAILGAGMGIGRIGGSAVEATARQPEAGGTIQTQMLIAAALIEGATVIALIFLYVISSGLSATLLELAKAAVGA
jgi:F-type H+-transporting ATPase subunit c